MASGGTDRSGSLALSRRGFLRTGLLGADPGPRRHGGSRAGIGRHNPWLEPPRRPHAGQLSAELQSERGTRPLLPGKKKGFYSEEGVDLNILPGTGSATTVKLVERATACSVSRWPTR